MIGKIAKAMSRAIIYGFGGAFYAAILGLNRECIVVTFIALSTLGFMRVYKP